jgi:hypothetical protein
MEIDGTFGRAVPKNCMPFLKWRSEAKADLAISVTIMSFSKRESWRI